MTDYAKFVAQFDEERPSFRRESDGQHMLNDRWVLWSHVPAHENDDWSLKSYRRHLVIETVEEFWNLFNGFPSLVNKDMWFLMREGVPPIWEHEVNAQGGSFKFRVGGDKVDNVWLTLAQFLVTENMCINPDDSVLISGISMSPKQNSFSTINIWNLDSGSIDCAQFPGNIDGIDFKLSRYHSHQRRKQYKKSY